jgi:hypothetical protein
MIYLLKQVVIVLLLVRLKGSNLIRNTEYLDLYILMLRSVKKGVSFLISQKIKPAICRHVT